MSELIFNVPDEKRVLKAAEIMRAKELQGYTLEVRKCSTCGHYRSEKEKHAAVFGGQYYVERAKFCFFGGFTVKSSATCDLWSKKS